jgi:hypothetical protein
MAAYFGHIILYPSSLKKSGSTETALYPNADTRAHCEWTLSEKVGVLMYWNTTFKPARTWLDLCYHGCLYDPYQGDPWTDTVRAWYDGTTADQILQIVAAGLSRSPQNTSMAAA